MLHDLKLMLGISAADTSQDGKLELIIATTSARLKILLGGVDPPESMSHIILEVSIMRFNRIGSEGLSGHSVEGESLQFAESDFVGFSDEIQAFLEAQSESLGKVRFL